MKKKHSIWLGVIGVFLLSMAFLYWQNFSIQVDKTTFDHSSIPTSFDGFRVVHISDLHNQSFGVEQKRLIKKVDLLYPDIVVITGDLVDSKDLDDRNAIKFIEEIANRYPIYFVSGNHEAWRNDYQDLKIKLKRKNVIVLDNDVAYIEKNHGSITIMGLMDPAFEKQMMEQSLTDLMSKHQKNFTILLSHRPEYFPLYVDHSVDLVFSGHAHGGQFRLFGKIGVYAPDQGLFPRYIDGMYAKEYTTMVVSRGLGNSIIPFRLYNRPQIGLVILSQSE